MTLPAHCRSWPWGTGLALAAQDTAANLIGGVVILTEKPFTIGDWIVAGKVEGIVEDITFRSTKVRTFAQALVAVPNASLAKEPITNWTRMGKRRVNFSLGVDYSTPRQALERCIHKIRELWQPPDVHPAVIFLPRVREGPRHPDTFLRPPLSKWLSVREEILFNIMRILEEEGVAIALPSRVIVKGPLPAGGAE